MASFVPQQQMVPGGAGAVGMSMPGTQQHTWHDQVADTQLRQQLTSHIIQIFAKKRGQQAQNWGQRLGDFVRRLEDQLYFTARSKEEYMDLSTLEQRLQLVARSMAPTRGNGNAQAAPPQQQQAQQALPPGMMPNPGPPQLPAPGMGGAGGGMQFPQGQPNGVGPAGMPGFMPTAGTNGAFGQADDMHLRNPALGNGVSGGVSSPVVDGTNPGLMHGFGHNGVAGNMLRNGQRDMGYGMQGQQGSLNHSASLPRTSMNGMPPSSGNDMQSLNGGMMPFMPNPGMGAPTNGMIPVNSNMHQPMLNMQAAAPGASGMLSNVAQKGSGMIPVNGMMPPQGVNGMMQPPGNFNMGLGMMPTQNGGPPAPQPGMMGTGDMTESSKTQYVQKQQRWLLFLRHCAKCRQSETECQLQAQCKFGKQLWQHILHCAVQNCPYPRCSNSKDLLKHHQKCQSPQCPICAPVKEYVRKTRMQQQQAMQQQQPPQQQQQQLQPPQQNMAGHPGMQQPGNPMMNPQAMQAFAPMPPMPPMPQQGGNKRPHNAMANYPQQGGMPQQQLRGMPGGSQQMFMPPGNEQQTKRVKTADDPVLGKNTYTSLLETFTVEQITHHKDLIFQASQQQRNTQQPPASQSDLCTVCQCTKLLYEPPVLYCSMCGLKIKRTQTYWSTPPEQQDSTLKGCWCHQCYTEAKERLPVFGVDQTIKKADLIKRKNDEEIEEPWVQCDMCEAWVHQICGLFNKGRNTNATHYLCPDCLIKGSEMGKRSRIEQRPQAMLECKDLPHCELSKFLENRLIVALEHERGARAAKEGRLAYEVATAEALSIRVVNNVVKKCEVKSRFLDSFGQERDVSAFPYRQRVVLLFQNLDGVDVCLFTMYVQEYGEDCPEPNKNCVYLSYLDSVKYFRPELNAVAPTPTGNGNQNVALRTFVYHQILIGYLSYVKMLGYTQMYIWACPPMQGDDYILYCHPHKQKTPRSDRLRNWYLDMLRQAKSEGIVVHLTTLWDTYFQGGKDHRLERCSSTAIPYLEGDYWPGEAENQLLTISDSQRQANKNSGSKGGAAGRAAKGKRYGSGPATTDEQLMERLGEILGGNMKEDFIVVHMQEVCTFCRKHVLGGNNIFRYRSVSGVPLKAPAERKFEGIKLEASANVPTAAVTQLNICESCYTEENVRHTSGLKLRLPANLTPQDLSCEKIEPQETQGFKDPDPDLENEFFETRQSFLSLCQGNHYQFDTLRRAKHSSMMVLYHLHNPSEPAFTSTCNLCNNELAAGTGFRCTQCQDFDICADCKKNRGHEHPLVPSRHYDETRMRMTDQERQERNENLQRTMALLVHACSCNNPNCSSSSCRKVQALFTHALHCQLKLNGNCVTCKKMWCLLTLHAKSCTKADCQVPRCKDFKEMRRRQTARQEEKRRVAYQKMLRNQSLLQQQGH